jgi:hypothetical protein
MTHKLTYGFIEGFKTQCEPAGMNDKYRNIDGTYYWNLKFILQSNSYYKVI